MYGRQYELRHVPLLKYLPILVSDESVHIMTTDADAIRILHVDDNSNLGDVTSTFLERKDDRFTVSTATNASEGLQILSDHEIDCIISDYEMPGRNGIEFLETVREEYPDLPFILFTGKGSEAVASEAISAGVTDYLQKETGSDHYAVLANRVANSVEKYHAEQAQERNRVLVEEATDAILIVGADAMIHYATPSAESVLGRSPAELVGTSGFDPVHPDDRTRVVDKFAELSQQPGGRRTVEFRYERPDGNWIWAEARGRNLLDTDVVDGIVIYTRDITEHKEREQELKDQTEELEELTTRLEAQYRTLFEEAPVMAVVTRESEGRQVIKDCNERFLDTLGYEKEAIVGTELAEVYTADSEERLLDAGGLERSVTAGCTRERRDLVTVDGEIIETVLRAVPRPDAPGGVVDTLAMYVDITEREEVKRANERLEEFTRIVSHDLRNPLNVATGQLALAREECDSEYLDAVKRSHERMDALITDLLTFAREGETATDITTVAVAELTETCWQNVDTADATLVTATDRVIRADESRLAQLFENLIRNSVEHGDSDVTVTIGELEDGFYVADDGPGIPPEDRDDVFEAGYSTVSAGTGFGLSIVEQIVEAHDWEISVVESADGGVRFEITGVEFS
jgi:PAS domain S-box-containing protein